MKKCSYCAEEIQDEAIVCWLCKKELTPLPAYLLIPKKDPQFHLYAQKTKCPYCANEIFETAIACEFCTRPFRHQIAYDDILKFCKNHIFPMMASPRAKKSVLEFIKSISEMPLIDMMSYKNFHEIFQKVARENFIIYKKLKHRQECEIIVEEIQADIGRGFIGLAEINELDNHLEKYHSRTYIDGNGKEVNTFELRKCLHNYLLAAIELQILDAEKYINIESYLFGNPRAALPP